MKIWDLVWQMANDLEIIFPRSSLIGGNSVADWRTEDVKEEGLMIGSVADKAGNEKKGGKQQCVLGDRYSSPILFVW